MNSSLHREFKRQYFSINEGEIIRSILGNLPQVQAISHLYCLIFALISVDNFSVQFW